MLLEKFRCTDTVVTMLQKRREICSFNKLKQAVEEMTRRYIELYIKRAVKIVISITYMLSHS